MDTLTLLRASLQERLNVEPERVEPEVTLESLGVDSLMLLELIFELEEKLNIKIPEDVPNPVTCGDVVALVDKLRSDVGK